MHNIEVASNHYAGQHSFLKLFLRRLFSHTFQSILVTLVSANKLVDHS